MRVVRVRRGQVRQLLAAAPLFDDPPDLRACRAYLADPANIFLLAQHEGKPVGFLRGTALRQLHCRKPQMFLYEIAVADGFRRQGVGRELVRRLLDHCRRRGFEEAFVFTSPSNRPAVGLYRSTGGVTETDADRMYVYRLRPRATRRATGRRRPAVPTG
ncbi:MAG: GNAT family N-acetyltransferase [Thermoplasmata archaeon]|nr:GNAT family N-acetyltransferase [Thermoplasmata archaeon]